MSVCVAHLGLVCLCVLHTWAYRVCVCCTLGPSVSVCVRAGLVDDDRLYSAVLRSLEQTHCARMWFYMSDQLYSAFFKYPPKWCTYSAGMAGAT